MIVAPVGGSSCCWVRVLLLLLLPLLLPGRVGRALVEALRECRVLGRRWRDTVVSVGVRAPLRWERALLSDVSGGRLVPARCGGRVVELLAVLLVAGRVVWVVRDDLDEALIAVL
jgi:hypothetical protein